MAVLDQNQLFVKEKAFKIFNHFEIYDQNNKMIGQVKQAKNWLGKIAGIFQLEFYDGDRAILKVKKPFSLIRPKAYVYDENNNLLGYFVKKIVALRPRFYLLNPQDQQIGMLEGDFIGWSFNLLDQNKQPAIEVNKKFSGIAREMFTTADAYKLYFSEQKTIDKRLALAAPFIIDLLLKEKKRGSRSSVFTG